MDYSVESRHCGGLDAVGDVNVGLHGFVVVVAGPLHDNVGRDAKGECFADERLAPGVGA